MNINDKFYDFDDSQFTSEVNRLLDQASATISWYGSRLIVVNGYKGSHSLDLLTQRYFNTLKDIAKYIKNKEELPDYFRIWSKLKNLYVESDKLIEKSFFARFCNFFEALPLKDKLNRDSRIAAVQEYVNFLQLPKDLAFAWKPEK